VIRAAGRKRIVDWAFGHYLGIAPPDFAGSAPTKRNEGQPVPAAA
jgi:hypothetical protein